MGGVNELYETVTVRWALRLGSVRDLSFWCRLQNLGVHAGLPAKQSMPYRTKRAKSWYSTLNPRPAKPEHDDGPH